MKMFFILWVLVGLTLCNFAIARSSRISVAPSKDGEIIINLNPLYFDYKTDTLSSIIRAVLPPSIMNKDGKLNRGLVIAEQYTADNSIIKIPKDTIYSGFNSGLKLINDADNAGSEFLYPFDVHKVTMKLFVSEESESGKYSPVPFAIDCSKCYFEGSRLKISEHIGPDLSHELKITIKRSLPIKLFCIFINAIILTVAICVLIMAVRITRSFFRTDIAPVLGFIGGLLFALPAVRNLQPTIPPIGVILDYCGFFEAEFMLIIALIVVLVAWLRRTPISKVKSHKSGKL